VWASRKMSRSATRAGGTPTHSAEADCAAHPGASWNPRPARQADRLLGTAPERRGKLPPARGPGPKDAGSTRPIFRRLLGTARRGRARGAKLRPPWSLAERATFSGGGSRGGCCKMATRAYPAPPPPLPERRRVAKAGSGTRFVRRVVVGVPGGTREPDTGDHSSGPSFWPAQGARRHRRTSLARRRFATRAGPAGPPGRPCRPCAPAGRTSFVTGPARRTSQGRTRWQMGLLGGRRTDRAGDRRRRADSRGVGWDSSFTRRRLAGPHRSAATAPASCSRLGWPRSGVKGPRAASSRTKSIPQTRSSRTGPEVRAESTGPGGAVRGGRPGARRAATDAGGPDDPRCIVYRGRFPPELGPH